MQNVFDTLKERGLIAQTTHEDEIRKMLGEKKITFYIGFDPTADSLHICLLYTSRTLRNTALFKTI